MTSTRNNGPIIKLEHVSKFYRSYTNPRHRLLELISNGRKEYSTEIRALDDVSFSLQRGARLGIIGNNGSGKSTLLKVLAGVLTPGAGEVVVNGRVSALLELGAGFNPEISGEENIRQFCMLHGMHQDEAEAALPQIITFSELGDVIRHPTKTYSSGMAVRLGFACAVNVQPEILIVDEALSVGDAYFQNKCLHKIRSMLDEGVTFLYVTHAADSIRSLCNEGLWLHHGQIRKMGTSADVGAAYQREVFSRMTRAGIGQKDDTGDAATGENTQSEPALEEAADKRRILAFQERVEPLRTGSGEIRIDDIVVLDEFGDETDSLSFDSDTCIRVVFHLESALAADAAMTVGIMDINGRQLLHFNSEVAGIYASGRPAHIPQVIDFSFKHNLCPGEYNLVAGISVLNQHPAERGKTVIESVIDYCAGGARFAVHPPQTDVKKDLWGVVHVEYSVVSRSLD
jgi:lipopolysaccharide transport system ATP-binding protein